MPEAFTLIHPEGLARVDASTDGGRVRRAPGALEQALGWQLRAEGLWRGERCVPVRGDSGLVDGSGVDLEVLADLLALPLAVDVEAGAAVLGTAHSDRAAALESLEAPDFALPDANGRLHRLSDYRGKKVLLIAYASW